MRWQRSESSSRRATAIDCLVIVFGAVSASWAAFPIAIVLYAMVARAGFPFDLEWCEGGSMYQAYRVLHGLPLYARTDASWAPFPYPPAHTLLLALLGMIRLDFWMGRLASIVSFAIMCAILGREVFIRAKSKLHGTVAGLFALSVVACAYPVIGQWYDLVRVDSLMMLLCIGGTSLVVAERMTRARVLAASVLFTMALFTKQTSVFFVAWACLFTIVSKPKAGIAVSVVTLSMTLSLVAFAQWFTGGGFWFWVVTNLARQQVDTERLTLGLTTVLRFAPFAAAIPPLAIILGARKLLSARAALWTGSFLASIPASLLPFAKAGGYLNNLMPMLVLVGPVTMLLAIDLANASWGVPQCVVRWLPVLGMGVFVWLNPLNPESFVPGVRNYRAAKKLNTFVRELKGGVVAPYFAFLPARNGHVNPHWHRMVVLDAYYRGDSMNEAQIFETTGARWALVQSADNGPFESYVRRHFVLSRRLPGDMQVHTITGALAAVDELWEKR